MLSIKFIPQRIFVLFCLLLIVETTWASEPLHIGHVTGLENEVISRTAAGEKKLQLNEKIFFKQQILTQDKGKVELTFRDGSTFAIAPKSVVILDEFIFNPAENMSEKSVNVLKGSFRYISGFAIKNSKTEVKTPFGTAGIRGSLVVANANGSLDLFVGNGQVTITTVDGKSQATLTTGLGGSTSGGQAAQTQEERTAQIAAFFTQANFWVDLANNQSTPEERGMQAAENARGNGATLEEQKAAYNAAVDAPAPSQTEIEPLPPVYTNITTDPKEIIAAYNSILTTLYTEKSTAATLLIVEAAIRNNPADAAAITTAAVAANPRLAAAITQTAVATAPNLGAAIAEAATKGLAESKKEEPKKDDNSSEAEKQEKLAQEKKAEQDATAAIFSATINAQQENPATTDIKKFEVSNVESALAQGKITESQAAALIVQINTGNTNQEVPISPSK